MKGNRFALEYGISTAAISKIIKNREEILKAVSNSLETIQKKTLHKPEYEELEKKLFEWFLNQHARNRSFTSTLLKERAKFDFNQLYPDKGESGVKDGWLDSKNVMG